MNEYLVYVFRGTDADNLTDRIVIVKADNMEMADIMVKHTICEKDEWVDEGSTVKL